MQEFIEKSIILLPFVVGAIVWVFNQYTDVRGLYKVIASMVTGTLLGGLFALVIGGDLTFVFFAALDGFVVGSAAVGYHQLNKQAGKND